MAPPKTPKDVVEAIEHLWAENPRQSGTRLWREYHPSRGVNKPSLRRFQQIIAEAKKKAGDRMYPLVEWVPWRNERESGEDRAYLLHLDAISLAYSGRHLYQHEAKWGRRLRTALNGMSPWEQYVFTFTYAVREIVAYRLRKSRPYTADLDGILAYRPWLPENLQAYEEAIIGGSISPPLAFGFEDMRENLDAEMDVRDHEGHTTPERIETYLEHISYWKVAKRMLGRLSRRAGHVDREAGPFKAWALDRALEFWDSEHSGATGEAVGEVAGGDDERQHQAQEEHQEFLGNHDRPGS